MRWFSWFFFALFVAGALLQLNDPDPWRWALIYAAAALVCLGAALGRAVRWPALAVLLVALGWAVAWLPRITRAGLGDMFASWKMVSANAEDGRELIGLLLIAVVMGAQVGAGRTRR